MDTAVEVTRFGTIEYLVVVSMLILSVLIGVYYTFWSKQDSFNEYMLGGRNVGVFPVAMSMVASNISGLALVGTPAEAYSYGTLYFTVLVTDILVPFANICFFLPIFYSLELNSVYEYLNLRFGRATRVLGSLIFAISQLIYLPAIIYVPALVFNQVSGVSVSMVAFWISAICIVYTTLGGMKAVLWTDVLQNIFSLLAVLFIIYLGVSELGGMSRVFHINQEGGRVEFFNMELSPFVRNSFWTMTLGSFSMWMANLSIHPGAVQRCICVSSINKAKRALLWTTFGVMFVHATTVFMGMVVYARYHGCDPIATGEVRKTGQLLPLYVMEVTRDYPGLAGLFVSGVLSAALSSMSAAFNTMAGAMYEDIVEPFMFCGKKQSDLRQSVIMKILSFLLGVLCVSLTLAVEKTESIFQIGMSLAGVTSGALLCLFILGIFFPRANSKGAIVGAISSLVVMTWIMGNAQYYLTSGLLRYPGKHTSVDLCPQNYTGNLLVQSRLETHRGYSSPVVADPSVPLIFQMSYMYYTVCGTVIGVVIGLIVSMVTDPPDLASMDRRLLSHLVQHLLPPQPCKVEEELTLMKIQGEISRPETTCEERIDEGSIPRKSDINAPE